MIRPPTHTRVLKFQEVKNGVKIYWKFQTKFPIIYTKRYKKFLEQSVEYCLMESPINITILAHTKSQDEINEISSQSLRESFFWNFVSLNHTPGFHTGVWDNFKTILKNKVYFMNTSPAFDRLCETLKLVHFTIWRYGFIAYV